MSRFLSLCVSVVLCTVMAMSFAGCATPNLPEAKAKVIRYYEQGAYEKEVTERLKKAMRLLPAPGSYNTVGSAVVFDIDDTVLSTYEYQKGMGFGHYGPTWHEWLSLGRAPAIRPVLKFYLLAKERGLPIFFVTGRREKFRSITEENLRGQGFTDWEKIFMKPTDWHGSSVSDWKANQRMAIESMGYKIILNIGDQKSDLLGGFAEHTVLLPNYIYEVR